MSLGQNYTGLLVLLPYLAIFEQPGYSHGEWAAPPGYWPEFTLSPGSERFVRALYDDGIVHAFDWLEWQEEAVRLYDNPHLIAEADALTLRRLLTLHVRKDRFCTGHLAAVLGDGHVTAILRRIALLPLEEPPIQ